MKEWDEVLGDRVIDRGIYDDGKNQIEWMVAEAPFFGVNGYVRIPTYHPWHDLSYDKIHEMHEDLEVHGGLTFADYGWIGFDTAHAFDVWTGPYAPDKRYDALHSETEWDVHWTVEQVISEAKNLARQVAEAMQ